MTINKTTATVITDVRLEEHDLIECYYCGDMIPKDNALYDVNGNALCECCAMDNYTICEDCGDLIDNEEIHVIYNYYGDVDRYVCTSCLDSYYYCESCGEWFTELARGNRCINCQCDLIADYHDGNPNGIQFHGELNFLSYVQGHFGLEVEVFGDENTIAENVHDVADFDVLHFEHDCSVDLELVFQPVTIEYMTEHKVMYHDIMQAIQQAGGHSGSGAGLHVHVSRTAFGDTIDEATARISHIMELFSGDNFERMATIAGRDSCEITDWCRAFRMDKSEMKSLAKHGGGNRYNAVNLNNDDTVEFRLGKSTTDADELVNWVTLIAYIVRQSASMTDATATDFNAWFFTAPDSIKRYIESKGVAIEIPIVPMDNGELIQTVYTLASQIVRLERSKVSAVESLGGYVPSDRQIWRADDVLKSVAGLSDGQIRYVLQ